MLAGKTVCLGPYVHARDTHVLAEFFPSYRGFPMGGVEKPPPAVSEWRATSDHTRTGLNEATNLDALRHAITVYADLARFHHSGSVMRVSDIEGAFALLLWHPEVWCFLLFEWVDLEAADTDMSADVCLYVNVCGDFGASGMPGAWRILFEGALIGMARHQHVLTLPMAK